MGDGKQLHVRGGQEIVSHVLTNLGVGQYSLTPEGERNVSTRERVDCRATANQGRCRYHGP